MEDQRAAAPQITITDPNNPGDVVDVLGSGTEREPWRPSARALKVTAVVVVVLLVIGLPVAFLQHRSGEQQADRRSVAQLALTVPDAGEAAFTGFDPANGSDPVIALHNAGPAGGHVVGARVDREGYAKQRVEVNIAAGKDGPIPVPLEKTCPSALPHSGPGGVLLDLVTTRGVRTTLRVRTLDSQFAQDYLDAQRVTCGLYSLEESVESDLVSVTVGTGKLVVSLDLANLAKAPRTLTALTPPDGFALGTDVTLPTKLPSANGVPLGVVVTLRVTDCAKAIAAPSLDVVTRDGTLFGQDLTATVSGDGDTTRFPFSLPELYTESLSQLIATACPHG